LPTLVGFGVPIFIFKLIFCIKVSSLHVTQALPLTTRVYDGCGFRSCVMSHVPKRNIKTKLQINTSPAAGINTMLWPVAFLVNLQFYLAFSGGRVEVPGVSPVIYKIF